jgi:hypothetical protein
LSVILFWRSGWVCCIGDFGGAGWVVSELSVILFWRSGWVCCIGDFGGAGWVCCRVWWSLFSLASQRVVDYSILAERLAWRVTNFFGGAVGLAVV